MVVVTGEMGELGIAPKHAPLITRIKPGYVRVTLENGEQAEFYVSGGIHARDYGHPDEPDAERLLAFLEKHGQRPIAVIPRLR